MVGTEPARSAPGPALRRAPNVLHKKLWRDIRHGAMQFVAIMILCAIGTWVYAGLDGAWRMVDQSFQVYFDQCNMADLWVNASSLSKNDLDELANLDGVEAVQARFTTDMDTPELGDDVSLLVNAVDGDPVINMPYLRQGELIKGSDRRGCLVEEQFAQAHDLNVGDSLKLEFGGQELTFTIRGLVLSSEHLVTSKDVSPDPNHYGFAIISWDAVGQTPLNEAVLTVKEGVDASRVESAIQDMLPEALILDHHSQPSAQRADSETGIFRNLSYVFPAMAFAVAAMVVLTTLTRMIENQRTQMGTLKALGYGDRKIRAHYLNYAFVPSIFGALLGLFVGRYTLPDMLYDMEAGHYIVPQKIRPPISLSAWGMTALMVALSVAICLYTYHRAAQENTAALLRPKPPRAGNRILLERWTGLWSRFSFNNKMVIRSIARNKGRSIMAMIGLLCCNMLITCAMGLQDSIDYCIGDYYMGTFAYDVRAELDGNGGTLESYQSRLDAERIEGVMEKSVSIRREGVARTVTLCVMSEDQQLMRLGENQQLLALPDSGLTVSRKLADVMKLKVGDSVEIWLPSDDKPVSFTVAQVTATTIGQTAYLPRKAWESLHKGEFRPTALLLQNPTALCRHELDEMDEVSEQKLPARQYEQSMTMMDSTRAVFSLMYGAALGLAFVICYNMGLMNFTERVRDYATLKVLGYHQKEIRRLMMRENDLITIAGVLLGVYPGLWLTGTVLSTVDSETMMWISHVAPTSIVLSAVITSLFSILLELFLTRKVRSIDMVEALKSVE